MKISEWMLKMSDNVTSTMTKLNSVADHASSRFDHLQGNISRFEGGLKNSGGFIDGVRNKLSGLAPIIATLGLSIGALGFTNATITNAGAYQQSIAELSAITGIVGHDLDELKQKGLEVGAASGLGAAKASEAYKLLASNIDVASIGGVKGLEMLQEKTITLAQAAQVDLPTAANTMAATINQFSLKATDSARVINTLAAGAKYGAAEIPDLSESLREAGGTAANMGISLESTVGALEILSQNAVKGSSAGTDLRNIMLMLETRGIPGVNLKVDGLSKSLAKLAPRLQDSEFLTKTFGLQNVNSATILIKNAAAMEEMTKRVTGTGVAYEQASTQTDTYQGKLAKVKATVEVLMIKIGEKLLPPLARMFDFVLAHTDQLEAGLNSFIGVVSTVANAIGSVIKVAWEYRDVLVAVGVGVGIAATAYGALILATKLHTWYTGLSTAAIVFNTLMTEGWSAAMIVLNMALLANPIVLIVAAIAALAAGIYYAWNHCETFRGIVMGVWEVLKSFFTYLWGVVKQLPLVSMIVDIVKHWDMFKFAVEAVYDFVKPLFKKIYDAAMVFLQPIIDVVKGVGSALGWLGDKLGITSKFEAGYAEGSKGYDQKKIDSWGANNPEKAVENFVTVSKKKGATDEQIEKYLNANGYEEAYKKFKTNQAAQVATPKVADDGMDKLKSMAGKWKEDESAKKANSNAFASLDRNKTDDAGSASKSNGSTSIEGKNQVRNVTVNIAKLVENINISTTQLKESASEIRRIVEEAILKAVQGSEIALSNE